MSRQTISTITDKVVEGMVEWQNRRLDPVYPVIFIDAIHIKIRDGQVANGPIYVALAVTCEGRRDILGLWAGDGGEGAKYWLHVLTELKNRDVADVLMVVCDGLTGLPDAITTVWPVTITQTCIVHLLRNSFRYAGRQHWDAIAKALKPVYTAATEAAARERFAEFAQEWSGRYPAIVRCVNARGHFPNEQAALKCVYMAIMSLDPTGTGRKRMDHALETRPERLRQPPGRRTQVVPFNPELHRSFDRPEANTASLAHRFRSSQDSILAL